MLQNNSQILLTRSFFDVFPRTDTFQIFLRVRPYDKVSRKKIWTSNFDEKFVKKPKDRHFSVLYPEGAVFQHSGLSRDCIGRSATRNQFEDTIDSVFNIYASRPFV